MWSGPSKVSTHDRRRERVTLCGEDRESIAVVPGVSMDYLVRLIVLRLSETANLTVTLVSGV